MSRTIRYTARKNRYERYLKRLEQSFNTFVRLKLLVLLVGLAASGYFLARGLYPVGGGLFLAGVFLLVALDIGQRKIMFHQKQAGALREINEQSLGRLDGRWVDFKDTGSEFQDDAHPYTTDLDIFGRGSLFQWLNVTRTFLGRQKLSRLLTSAPEPLPVIRERQTAIAELARSLSWRQWFLAYGTAASSKMQNPEFLFQWVKDRNPLLRQTAVIFGLHALPVLTIAMLIINHYTKALPLWLPGITLLLQYLLLKIDAKKRALILEQAGSFEKNLGLYSDLIGQILKKDYDAPYLQKLKQQLYSRNCKSASQQLRKLARIVDWITARYNGFYGLLNLFTLWDYQCLIALERWKGVSGTALRDWLDTIAEFEALSSLAIPGYDHPEWATPEFQEGAPLVKAQKMGHPLLPDAVRVANPLHIGNQTKVLLVTGSNMSGKSTYLRTIGINLVLAFTGAPVCAASFQCTAFDLYTCMRVSDNLEKNISSFYAEILRIKTIVAASATSRPIFFLLDEIFKGTNSLDRHTGAKILIKKLIQNGAMGLVSTHDLELGELEQELATVRNYHFQEHFQNNQLHFDYQLRSGISTTRNAIYLMRAAGIVTDEG